MSTANELSISIKQLVQAGQHAQALDEYKKWATATPNAQAITREHDFLPVQILQCLQKTEQSHTVHRFLFQYLRFETMNHVPVKLLHAYGWCLFAWSKIQPIQHPCVEQIQQWLQHVPIAQNEVTEALLLHTWADVYTQQNNADWKTVEQITARWQPEHWSDQPRTIQIQGEQRTIASHREQWYMLHTRALYNTQQWDACIQHCTQALHINPLHYGNHVWLARRLAQCQHEQGNTQQAITAYNRLVKIKNEWFLWYELALLHAHTKQYTQALWAAAKAALAPAKPHLKNQLYGHIAQWLHFEGKHQQALWHITYAIHVRKQQSWNIDTQWITWQQQWTTLTEQHATTNTEQLASMLKTYWQQTVQPIVPPTTPTNKPDQTLQGVISKLLHTEGVGDGFIRLSNGRSCYFRFNVCRFDREHIQPNTTVRVQVQQVQHKDKTAWQATRVWLADTT